VRCCCLHLVRPGLCRQWRLREKPCLVSKRTPQASAAPTHYDIRRNSRSVGKLKTGSPSPQPLTGAEAGAKLSQQSGLARTAACRPVLHKCEDICISASAGPVPRCCSAASTTVSTFRSAHSGGSAHSHTYIPGRMLAGGNPHLASHDVSESSSSLNAAS
jgi:hypothetical protein